ncbi:Ribosomal protein L24 [Methanonatronarchaeum thermophilum]|uniref:Large ribosomal subunit protein uL24 n=1 Tax=Methanonatronarchaeum thermophilum TaxID=1927129 RepID=A0A1Y3GHC2_9EURY|nr:50S ribosomal protein L24 [Methanonatronarchaeum thermophilum]OUJ18835.1 Ribosomal protein L24 [Methanonatronarchaeum thermophilum]
MTKQPRKQRKNRSNAPLHKRQKYMGVNLSEKLQEKFGKKTIPVKVGDEVEVVRGDHKGEKGEVTEVDMKQERIAIEGLTIRKSDDSQVPAYIHPSNLKLIDLDTSDRMRVKQLER